MSGEVKRRVFRRASGSEPLSRPAQNSQFVVKEHFNIGGNFERRSSGSNFLSKRSSGSHGLSITYDRGRLGIKSRYDVAISPLVPAGNAGMPTDIEMLVRLLTISRDRFGLNHELQSKLLFWSGPVPRFNIAKTQIRYGILAFQMLHLQVTGKSYEQFIYSKNGLLRPHAEILPFVVRQAMACARFAKGKTHVMLNSIEDGLRSDSFWNYYIRPILEANEVDIIWLDRNGDPREPVYPPELLVPGKYCLEPQLRVESTKRRLKRRGLAALAPRLPMPQFVKISSRTRGTGALPNLRSQSSGECFKLTDTAGPLNTSNDPFKHNDQPPPTSDTTHFRRTLKQQGGTIKGQGGTRKGQDVTVTGKSDTLTGQVDTLKGQVGIVTNQGETARPQPKSPRQSISPYLTLPFHPPPPDHPGLPSEQEMANLVALDLEMSRVRDVRRNLVFLCGEIDYAHVERFEKQRGVQTFPRLFKKLYRRYLVLPNSKQPSAQLLVAFVDRLTAAAATLAEKRAFVLIGSDQDGKRMKDQWNAYARPILQRNGVLVIWLDQQGRPRTPVYPPEVIPPEVYGPFKKDTSSSSQGFQAAGQSGPPVEPLSTPNKAALPAVEEPQSIGSPSKKVSQSCGKEEGQGSPAAVKSGSWSSSLCVATERDWASKRIYKYIKSR